MISERPSLATAIAPDLRGDGPEPFLERRLDDGAAAVVTVDYFGFPQPGLGEVAQRLAREVLVLPVRQGIDPAAIAAAADRLQW